MKNLTEGNPVKLMLSFALPVCIGNIFQLFYSLADTRIVGSVLGGNSLAAVGATTAISTLLIGFLQGLTNGFAIIAARSFGAKRWEELRKAAAENFALGRGNHSGDYAAGASGTKRDFKIAECSR